MPNRLMLLNTHTRDAHQTSEPALNHRQLVGWRVAAFETPSHSNTPATCLRFTDMHGWI